MTETCKPVPGFEDAYSLTPAGGFWTQQHTVIRSNGFKFTVAARERKVRDHPTGRRTVRLRRDGRQVTVRVDLLMRELFGADHD